MSDEADHMKRMYELHTIKDDLKKVSRSSLNSRSGPRTRITPVTSVYQDKADSLKLEELGKIVLAINADFKKYPDIRDIISKSFHLKNVSLTTPADMLVLIREAIDARLTVNKSQSLLPFIYEGILTAIHQAFSYFNKDVTAYIDAFRNDIYLQGIVIEILSEMNLMSYFNGNTKMSVWTRLLLALIIPIIMTACKQMNIGIASLATTFIDPFRASLAKPEFMKHKALQQDEKKTYKQEVIEIEERAKVAASKLDNINFDDLDL